MISDQKQKSVPSGKKKQKSKNHSLYDYHLAIKQSGNDAERYRHLGNYNSINVEGWHLPGTKESRPDCKEWKTEGCLDVEKHERNGFGRNIFVKRYQKTCSRGDCHKCVDKWINRNSDRASKRISAYAKKTGMPAFHLALSPSKENQNKPEKELRKEAMNILNEINIEGGALVFHPYRHVKNSDDWKYSPHFHFVGFGWMRLAETISRKYGWTTIYLGKRKFLFGTFAYLFSHCGIKEGRHAITWLGKLSYGKLSIPKPPTSSKCPCCNEYLVPIYHTGKDPPIKKEEKFEGFVDGTDWYTVKTKKNLKTVAISFEYDSRSSVNEILKGLAEAR